MEFLPIDKQEVLRYLGYQGQKIDVGLDEMINSCIQQCQVFSIPRYCYQIFDCHPEDDCIVLDHTSLRSKGNSIYEHLKDAKRVAVMAATLGAAFEKQIQVAEKMSMTKALVLDSCGTEYIEKVCDTIEEEIKQVAAREGYTTNFRFSPGYGDLPLEQQPEIIRLLDTSRKIGLTCTPTLIMLPRKSVTALIGFLPQGQQQEKAKPCDICQFRETCKLRKEGRTCGR